MEQEQFEKRKKIVYEFICSDLYSPMKIKELAIFFQVSKEERPALEQVLNALIAEGKICLSKKGKYLKAESGAVTGIFESHVRGFGFVTAEGFDTDIFIPEDQTLHAFPQDKVLVTITKEASKDRRCEGKVLRILEHGVTEVVGTFQDASSSFGFVIPDQVKLPRDIFVQGKHKHGAMDGHKVVVKIINYGDENRNPEGEIIEIIGHVNDPGTDIMSIVKAYQIPVEFPNDVMDEVKDIPQSLEGADLSGRKDFRELKTVTIDGEDAKDLDDAITLERTEKGYCLGVHIADVSHYVTENSPLDVSARQRGTSVYLVDRVIPMLPHALSNGICSLNQDTDRFTLSCIMDIDHNGNIIDHEICEGVIRVNRRMTYTAVRQILEETDEKVMETYQDYIDLFCLMKELADKLRKKRHERGAIDFDVPEAKIKLDERGRVVDVISYESNVATKIIEDFMLAANETVAEHFFWQETPFVYRSHEKPDGDKIDRFRLFIENFGYTLHLGGKELHPKKMQQLLEQVAGTEDEVLISRLALRSMQQARYTTTADGHFGLAAKYYCHFTSPIRRYPDLQIHRIIKEALHGQLDEKRISHYKTVLPQVAVHSSEMERRAEEAERDTIKLKKTEYMEQFEGEMFTGVISGVTAFGFYVELPNTVEGMVHVNTLTDDYYIYDEKNYQLIGETTGRTFYLGQEVTVQVTGTNRMLKQVDFGLVGQREHRRKKTGRKEGGRGKRK
jgi:ribonuclease R